MLQMIGHLTHTAATAAAAASRIPDRPPIDGMSPRGSPALVRLDGSIDVFGDTRRMRSGERFMRHMEASPESGLCPSRND
ncbi:hypothetical protein PRIPAC_81342 [Pristionchus pacificus]|uniref:Uncharacterized protein n=1 Tax=Pristionchus pacificus TaxID=54126 RepID=A0A2A6BH39_PRIPA|nr:hypothetical protein PRIPAC_81342 [Pristionchus pacificus]|eukprot:PDM65199.1 hypothetical protein PRIPAC_52141 [Pristionchus pacificus]